MKKLTAAQFVKDKNAIVKKIEEYKKQINKNEYTPLVTKYILDNTNVCIGKVYELEKNGYKPRWLKRFVVYAIEVQTFSSRFAFIIACGWWLDENGNPLKWANLTIYGARNSAVLKLSENQKNNKPKK